MDATLLLSGAAAATSGLSTPASSDNDNDRVPCSSRRRRGENKAKKDDDDDNENGKSNQCKDKLGRGSGSCSRRYRHLQKRQQCSKYYCVLFRVMKMVEITVDMLLPLSSPSSPAVWLVLLLLSECSFGGGGGAVEAVTVERGLQHYQHHRHHHRQNDLHANWHSANSASRDGGGNMVVRAMERRSGTVRYNNNNGGVATGADGGGRSEFRGLDMIVNRLEGKGPAGSGGGRRERRDYDPGSGSRDGDRGHEEVRMHQEDHRQQSPILPSSTSHAAAHKHRHSPPPPRGYHQASLNDDEEENEDKIARKNQEILSSNDHAESDDEHDEEDYDNDDDDDYDNNYDDDGVDLNTEDDKISHWAESYKSRYLAGKRKSTSAPTASTTTPVPPTTTTPALTYSQWKWQNLGNRQGLEQHRRHVMAANSNNGKSKNGSNNDHLGLPSPHSSPHSQQGRHGNHARSSSSGSSSNNSEPASRAVISEAIRHAMQVKEEAECKVPRPRVVHVQDLYPHPSKSYVPHCTILHQCSDDTGCCRQQTETCAPKNTHRVELPFYTISMDQSREPIVERLVFYNHTECECRDKMDEMMPRDQEYSVPQEAPSSSPPKLDSITNLVKVDDRDKKKFSLCKCPSAFNERPLPGDACSCDCFDGQTDCLHLKRGRDFFNLSDKWCIQSGRCEVPECAFGPYIHLIGRCPQKRDFDGDSTSWTKYLSS